MATSSLAAVAVQPRVTELREFPVPPVDTDSGILRVVATGVCGSDWPIYLDGSRGPRILGHEVVGTIAKLGDRARDRWGVGEGDFVALEEYLPCGHCEYCRGGEYRSCIETDATRADSIRYGVTPVTRPPSLWGGFSQFLYLHPRSVFHRVPAGVPSHIAAMALPIGNGFQWLYLDAKAGPGKTVLIQGPGQQGLGCVIAAKAAGASKIIVTGLARDLHRLEVARALGAQHTIIADKDNVLNSTRELTNGRMADIVVEVSGGGPSVIANSLALVRKRGTLILATRKGITTPAFETDYIVANHMTVRGVRGHSYEAVEMALQVMQGGAFDLAKMSTHSVGLHKVDAALKMLGGESEERSIHISVDPWKT